jgi:hypothetical protein
MSIFKAISLLFQSLFRSRNTLCLPKLQDASLHENNYNESTRVFIRRTNENVIQDKITLAGFAPLFVFIFVSSKLFKLLVSMARGNPQEPGIISAAVRYPSGFFGT